AGGATPIGDALVVVTSKMDRILEVRPEDRLAWVEPGVLNRDLANAVAPRGCTYAPDPPSQQTCRIAGHAHPHAGAPRRRASVELMEHGILVAAESFAHAGDPTDAAAVLLVEVDGLPEAVEAQSRAVENAARDHGVRTIRVAADDAERALLWKGRKSAFGAVAQIAPHYHLHDCVVPRSKLVDVLAG